MLLIDCPVCGQRSEDEFRCAGQAHLVRPGPPDAVTDEAWSAYLYQRTNLKGVNAERWLHEFGCRRWFNILRDTLTHQILHVYPVTEARRPEETGGGE